MVIILSLLVGYSFTQAVALFSQASRTALSYPALADGMTPLDGIFIPSFGAYYLVETFLLPFIIIQLIGRDKHDGTLKLLLQLPLSTFSLNAVKLLATAVIWLIVMVPGISVFIIWHYLGGSCYSPEIFCLILGHTLYTLIIITVAMFATAVAVTMPAAAMICLSVTLGSWVLAFAADKGKIIAILNMISLTNLLHQLECGLLSSTILLSFILPAAFFFVAASIFLHSGRNIFSNLTLLLINFFTFLTLFYIANQLPYHFDASENHRHSFSRADTRALQKMNKPLKITIHLAFEDGRLHDLRNGVLAKLQRLVANLRIVYAKQDTQNIFAAPESDDYGLIEYDYGNGHDESYSTSSVEILTILHNLAGQKVSVASSRNSSGHPLVADASSSRYWFYLFLPMLFLLSGYLARRPQSFKT